MSILRNGSITSRIESDFRKALIPHTRDVPQKDIRDFDETSSEKPLPVNHSTHIQNNKMKPTTQRQASKRAEIAGDAAMKKAFINSVDLHALTTTHVNGGSGIEDVTTDDKQMDSN